MGIDKTGFVSHRDVVLKRHFRFEKAAKKIFSKKNSMYFAVWSIEGMKGDYKLGKEDWSCNF